MFAITKNGGVFLDTLNRIKSLLKEKNKTQKDLTDFLGISKNAFSEWNSGKNSSYIKHVAKIASFFEVTTDYLLGNDDTKFPTPDYTYAAYDELTRELNPEQIKQLVDFANFLRQQNK